MSRYGVLCYFRKKLRRIQVSRNRFKRIFLNESTTKHLVTTGESKAMKLEYLKMKLNRRLVAPAIALAMVGSFGAYEFARPTTATAAVASPASAPLDDSSVSSLLSLD